MLFFNALVWLSRECRFAEISGQFWSPTGLKRLARTHSALLCQTAGIWGHGRGSYSTARTVGGKQGKFKYTVLRIMMIKKGARKTPPLRLPCLRRCYLGDRASTVLTDYTFVSSSQITSVLSVVCASLHFVPSTNVIAIGYAFVLVIVVSRMMSALKSGSRSPEPDGTDTQAGLKKSFGRRCCLACKVNG